MVSPYVMLEASVTYLSSVHPFLLCFVFCAKWFSFVHVPNVIVLFQRPGDQQVQPHHSHILPTSREDPEGEAGEGCPDPFIQPQQHQGTLQVKNGASWQKLTRCSKRENISITASIWTRVTFYLQVRNITAHHHNDYLSHSMSREEANWPDSLHCLILQLLLRLA